MEFRGTAWSTAERQAIDQSLSRTSALWAHLTRQQISQTISSLASQSLTRSAPLIHPPSLLLAMFHWNKNLEMWTSLRWAFSHKKTWFLRFSKPLLTVGYSCLCICNYACSHMYMYKGVCWYDDGKAKATTTEQVHSLTANRSWQFSSFLHKIINVSPYVLAFCFYLKIYFYL